MADEIYVLGGRPASVGTALVLPGKTPRELTDSHIASAYHELMFQLSESDSIHHGA